MFAHFLIGSVAAFFAATRTYWFTLFVVCAMYRWPSSHVSLEVWQWVAKYRILVSFAYAEMA